MKNGELLVELAREVDKELSFVSFSLVTSFCPLPSGHGHVLHAKLRESSTAKLHSPIPSSIQTRPPLHNQTNKPQEMAGKEKKHTLAGNELNRLKLGEFGHDDCVC